jgi:hypothetical protein
MNVLSFLFMFYIHNYLTEEYIFAQYSPIAVQLPLFGKEAVNRIL